MRSLIILEVEHGETTDPIDNFVSSMDNGFGEFAGMAVVDYSVRVDLPACFVLD
jgi:hypothetical protein